MSEIGLLQSHFPGGDKGGGVQYYHVCCSPRSEATHRMERQAVLREKTEQHLSVNGQIFLQGFLGFLSQESLPLTFLSLFFGGILTPREASFCICGVASFFFFLCYSVETACVFVKFRLLKLSPDSLVVLDECGSFLLT